MESILDLFVVPAGICILCAWNSREILYAAPLKRVVAVHLSDLLVSVIAGLLCGVLLLFNVNTPSGLRSIQLLLYLCAWQVSVTGYAQTEPLVFVWLCIQVVVISVGIASKNVTGK